MELVSETPDCVSVTMRGQGKTVSRNWGGTLGVELEAGKDKDGWSGTGTLSAGGSMGGESSAQTGGPAVVPGHEIGRLCVLVGRPVSWRFYANMLARKPRSEASPSKKESTEGST